MTPSASPTLPRMYAITDFGNQSAASNLAPEVSADVAFSNWLEGIEASGTPTMVQIREKSFSDQNVFQWASEARRRLPSNYPVLVNGRADIARAARADGVHLPSNGIPVEPLRKRFGPDFLIGRSTHSIDEVLDASNHGADFVTFGPVFSTPSKARYGPPVGLEALRAAVSATIPVFALGGVCAEQLETLGSTGAAGIAGIRAFLDPTRLASISASFERGRPTSTGEST